ncbi:hypothetical protein [Amycolatopsis sp. NPDC049868]|uniref:hypothetical protein n=1 Tax=Amycolatopsis sp. NPDC049868 TaxID=3363934 RepID=UPI003790D7DF
MTTDVFSVVLLWAVAGQHFGREAYAEVAAKVPWPWFQGHTRARAIVISITVGLTWPGVLLLDELCRIPAVERRVTAFLTPPRHQEAPPKG